MDDYSTIKAVNLILLETISKQITLEAQEEDRYIIKKGKRKLRNIIPKIAGMSFKEKKVNVTQIPYSQVIQWLRKMSGKSLEDKLDGTITDKIRKSYGLPPLSLLFLSAFSEQPITSIIPMPPSTPVKSFVKESR